MQIQNPDFRWNPIKAELLKVLRGISFEEIIESRLIDVKEHPNRKWQRIILFEYENYIWVVPFVEEGNIWFLKTLYRSRKYTKLYRRGEL